jgi:hypothetical protein
MPGWATEPRRIQHLAAVARQMPIGGLARVKLRNGTLVEGIVRRLGLSNNGGRSGWHYYGEVEIETKERDREVIDFLEIESAEPSWTEETATEYADLHPVKYA